MPYNSQDNINNLSKRISSSQNGGGEFKHDPEAGENAKKYRLPFALCKAKGIKIQDWWTPRDAWAALRNRGEVQNVSEEYADYYRELKKKKAKEYRKRHPERVEQSRLRSETKKRQLVNEEHNPDKNYQHVDGSIAGAARGEPMDFAKADSGSVNPFFLKSDEKTGVPYIGYRTNCQTCVATYIARRKGYDVRALPNLNNYHIADLSFNTTLAYIDKDGNHPKLRSKPYELSASEWLGTEIKAGEIHSVEFTWSGRNGGHIVTVEKLPNGELLAYDPQTNRKLQGRNIDGFFKGVNRKSIQAMNLTNYSLDEKFCDNIMKGVER